MKILIPGILVALMATAAVAQTAMPTEPAAPAAAMAPMEAAPPADAVAPAAAADAMLVQKDGKWWNGDREATKTEIAAYKKAKKAGNPG